MDRIEFISRIKGAVIKARNEGYIFNEAVLTAQAAHESAWGNSGLAIRGNNLFGIKAGKSWTGKRITLKGYEEEHGKNVYSPMDWRAYDSYYDCIVDYCNLLKRLSWFRDALQYADNADLFLKNILKEGDEPGWATDTKYFDKVKTVARTVQNLGGPEWT